MLLLFDTNVLIWAVGGAPQLSRRAVSLLSDRSHDRMFSSLVVAEVAIKYARGKPDFDLHPSTLRDKLLWGGLTELPLSGSQAERLADLPPIHKDPFDRLMIAQALVEGMTFVTADAVLGGYPGQVMLV